MRSSFLPEHQDGAEEKCCERYFFTCLASEDWPCLFHGVIEYPFPFLRDDHPITIGHFLFPESVSVVYRAYLVCSFEAASDACRGSPLATTTVRRCVEKSLEFFRL